MKTHGSGRSVFCFLFFRDYYVESFPEPRTPVMFLGVAETTEDGMRMEGQELVQPVVSFT